MYSSDINNDNSISNWIPQDNLPDTRYNISVISKDKNIYVLGGAMFNGTTNYKSTVYLSQVQDDGSISSWQALNSLPGNRGIGGAAIVGNYMYYFGGTDGNNSYDTIYFAPINPDGTIGAWQTSSLTLPFAMAGFSTVTYQNNIYIIGGSNGTSLNSVYQTQANISDGSLSSWHQLNSLPTPVSASNQAIVVGNNLIMVGGSITSTVYYTTINPDGTIQPFQTSANSLPQPIGSGAVAYSNGYVYITGGVDTTGYLNTVYYAKLHNSTNSLSVPLYKQTDPQWANNIYDNAQNWAPIGKQTISNWGCALTSAVMLLRYYGLTKFPHGEDMNPANLNLWLHDHSKAYIANGYINWPTISFLSKFLKPYNTSTIPFDMLEFDAGAHATKTQVTSDLAQNMPDILGVGNDSHFVVATGTQSATLTINDPGFANTDLNAYGNSFSSIKRFVPEHSDGSYIELFTDPTVTISVKNAQNHSVGFLTTEQSLQDDINGENSGSAIHVYYVEKPASGKYTVTLTSSLTQKYHLITDSFDINANDMATDYDGVLSNGNADTYTISFDKQHVNNSTNGEVVTFDSFLADVSEENTLHAFSNPSIGINLVTTIKAAQNAQKLHNQSAEKTSLQAAVTVLSAAKKTNVITSDAYTVLLADAQYLLGHL